MKRYLILLFLVLQLFGYGQRSGRRNNLTAEPTRILYPELILLPQKCLGDSIKLRTEISTTSAKPVKLFGFSMIQKKYRLGTSQKILTESDSLLIDKTHPIELSIMLIMEDAGPANPVLKFSSDQDHYKVNEMKFEFGAEYITIPQIRSGKEVFVNFPEKCADSVKVYFPYGGTASGASLHADSTSEQTIKSVSYGIGEDGNYLWFLKKDIGRYYVRYGACHWGNNFWLTIK